MDSETIDVKDFAESMRNAVKYAYEAIANPVEGTIISVIKDWAEHLYDLKDKIDDFINLLIDAFIKATESLNKTAVQMELLAKKNVVDAGAKGFVVFLEGMLEFFKTGKTIDAEILEHDEVIEEELIAHDDITFRYCTEALITGSNLDPSRTPTRLRALASIPYARRKAGVRSAILCAGRNTSQACFSVVAPQ